MARLTSTFLLLASALVTISAAPVAEIISRQDNAPATVNFAPYALVGCRMNADPHVDQTPSE